MSQPTNGRTRETGDLPERGGARLPEDLGTADTADAVSAVFGSLERSGDWLVAERIDVRAIFGDVKLDFRNADLPVDEVVELRCNVFFGELEITVPEGSDVEMDGIHAIFGDLKQGRARPRVRSLLRRVLTGQEEEPAGRGEVEGALFVVTGNAVFGDIKVITR